MLKDQCLNEPLVSSTGM
jgi:hypothetical protein